MMSLALAGMAQMVAAQDAKTKEKLPKGASVVDQFIKATGSPEAHAKIKNRVSVGTLEIVGAGIKAKMSQYAAQPDLVRIIIESETAGKMEQGVVDGVAWGLTVMTGPQIKEGDQRFLKIRESDFDGTVNWREHYKEAKCEGIETIDGKECYKVVLTPSEGPPVTNYYDRNTHLEVKSEISINSPMGRMAIESYPSDYKTVDGVVIAHKIRQVLGGMQEMLVVIDSIEHNAEIPPSRFEAPQEIRDLIEKRKADAAKPKTDTATPTDEGKTDPAKP